MASISRGDTVQHVCICYPEIILTITYLEDHNTTWNLSIKSACIKLPCYIYFKLILLAVHGGAGSNITMRRFITYRKYLRLGRTLHFSSVFWFCLTTSQWNYAVSYAEETEVMALFTNINIFQTLCDDIQRVFCLFIIYNRFISDCPFALWDCMHTVEIHKSRNAGARAKIEMIRQNARSRNTIWKRRRWVLAIEPSPHMLLPRLHSCPFATVQPWNMDAFKKHLQRDDVQFAWLMVAKTIRIYFLMVPIETSSTTWGIWMSQQILAYDLANCYLPWKRICSSWNGSLWEHYA